MAYDHKAIEKASQEKWAGLNLYETDLSDKERELYYLLVEFPYPSGDLHIGHWYAFAVTDIYARLLRLRGKNVLFPIGFDAFGLPAENAAIKNNVDPKDWTYQNMERMRKQLATMGASFDWSKEVVTCDPNYYHWTQWLFVKLFEHKLAERREAAVKWCPKDQTVLANEQVQDGHCERCGIPVEEKRLTQWFLKITDYADRLLTGLDDLPWREEIKEAQRAWIGKSEGAYLPFAIKTKIMRYVLLHGKGGSSEDNFFPSLRVALESAGYEVQVPNMPNASEPNDEEQADFVSKNCTLDENTIILGHSFGGIVALRLAERGLKFAGTVLVATPLTPVFLDGKERPTVRNALEKGYDFAAVQKNAGNIRLLYDTNDSVVPVSDGESYAQHLGGRATLTKVKAELSHFNSAAEPTVEALCLPKIKVFTTRPDTVFGATYVVLAPEHPFVSELLKQGSQTSLAEYVEATKRKTERDRSENKEKTGVRLEGVMAINPANKEEIPIYVADYVIGSYGTGSVMAVPAHDERDFEFSQKMQLPVRQVVAPILRRTSGNDAVQINMAFKERDAVMCVVKRPGKEEYLCLQWKKFPEIRSFISGGIEEGEDPVTAGIREIKEESGYIHPEFIRQIGGFNYTEFYHQIKKTNVRARFRYLYFELKDEEQIPIDELENSTHNISWKKKEEVLGFISLLEKETVWSLFIEGDRPYIGPGVLVNSGEFTSKNSDEATWDIVASVGGERVTQYRLRDWLVSRQRYWGCPIPVVYDPDGKPHQIPSEHLPWLLPTDVDFRPTGEAPLASSKELKERVTKIFGEGWTPEYDTLDTFVDSSWYFLRYLDSKGTHDFSDTALMKNWLPINRYSGGSEHTTMHLLYARFFTKALYDLALVPVDEPFVERFNRGLIMGPDGSKMSKSKGNVINPDEFVQKFGADAVRIYLAFIGPYNEPGSYPWNLDGVTAMRKFLERIYRLVDHADLGVKPPSEMSEELRRALAKASAKVAEDGDRFKFNTGVAALMILVNELESLQSVPAAALKPLLIMLAPFAPHLSEHLWGRLGEEGSIHQASWPAIALIEADTREVVVQVNGKRRGSLMLSTAVTEAGALLEAMRIPAASLAMGGNEPKRIIYIPGRIINIVV